MKGYISTAVIAALCLGLFCSFPALDNQALAQGKKAAASADAEDYGAQSVGHSAPDQTENHGAAPGYAGRQNHLYRR